MAGNPLMGFFRSTPLPLAMPYATSPGDGCFDSFARPESV